MARKNPEKEPRSGVAAAKKINLAVISFLALLALILAYLFVLYDGFRPTLLSSAGDNLYCYDGDTRACTVGQCSGMATCTGGVWGGCRWERVCVAGTTKVCTDQLCPSGVRECNPCGTGYGPCRGP